MRVVLACLACTTACGFHTPTNAEIDAPPEPVIDAPPEPVIDAAPELDAALPIDAPAASRTRTNLIGLWAFDEPAGAMVKTAITDTSDAVPKVPLSITFGTVTFANGTMTPDGETVIASAPAPHLDADVTRSGGVTLEAWVTPARADQGTVAKPVVIAGLSPSVMARNVSLLQIGTHWVARMRSTSDVNGGPDLVSTSIVVADRMTHLVVVADATQRVLYVDGQADRIDPAGAGAPLNWDAAYRMVLGNEIGHGLQWAGTFSLVAMYDRALAKPMIDANFKAGPSAP